MWILLHGFTGAPASWDRVLEVLGPATPAVRPALFGHGAQTEGIARFEDEVARLVAIASEHPSPRFVAGYSLGARLGLGMLVAAPELFDGALLIGLHPGLQEPAAIVARQSDDRLRAERLRERGLPTFVAAWESQPLFASQRTLPPEVLAAQRTTRLGHEAASLADSLDVLGLGQMPFYGHAFRRLAMPVTLMAGAADAKFAKQAERLASSRHQFRLVEGAGHNLLLEAPEAVATEMSRLAGEHDG